MASLTSPTVGEIALTPVAHPVLTDLSDEAVQAFLQDREAYLRVMTDCKNAGSAVEPVSLKASICPNLLMNLLTLKEFGDVTAETLTDADLTTWLQKQMKVEDLFISSQDVASAVCKPIRFRTEISHPKRRMMQLFVDFRTFMKEKGWEHRVESKVKESATIICSLLQPVTLRSRVSAALESGAKELDKDWQKFYVFCCAEAATIDQYWKVSPPKTAPRAAAESTTQQPLVTSNVSGRHRRGNRHRNRQKEPAVSGAGQEQKQSGDSSAPATAAAASNTVTGGEASSSTPSVVSSRSGKKKKDPPKCLNFEKCNGYHLLRQCPHTSQIERKKILEEYYATKNAGRSLKVLAQDGVYKKAVENFPTPYFRYEGLLGDDVPVMVHGDTGADDSALSADHLEACKKAGMYIPVRELDEPIILNAAFGAKDGEPANSCTVTKKVRLPLTLKTPLGAIFGCVTSTSLY